MNQTYDKEFIMSLYDEDVDMMVNIQKINTGMRSRIEEIVMFAKIQNYRKIGIAHCVSFTREARQLTSMLSSQFDVVSVDCKIGRISKQELVGEGYGPVCNPILQATVLNDEKTDLNIVMGLCVGHDILFSKYSAAPSTTLFVKDEMHYNNPLEGLE